VVALGIIALASMQTDPYQPPAAVPGPWGRGPDLAPETIRQTVHQPTATPWASLVLREAGLRVVNPPGAVGPPPHTVTPTPTSTPTPTPTPIPPTPTPEPVWPTWTPEPAHVAPAPSEGGGEAAGGVGGDWITSLICSYAWDCETALYVFRHESGLNPNAVNPSSGACGLAQLYPCPPGGLDPVTNLNYAWGKYVACGGGSFQCAWLAWW
jgi:hypothetical protein